MPKRVLNITVDTIQTSPACDLFIPLVNDIQNLLRSAGLAPIRETYKASENLDTIQVIYDLGSHRGVDNVYLLCVMSCIKAFKFKAVIGCNCSFDNAQESFISFGSSSKTFKKNMTVFDSVSMVNDLINNLDKEIDKIKSFNDQLKSRFLSLNEIAQILGYLYLYSEILTSSQISFIKKNISAHNYTALSIYKKISMVLELSHPNSFMNDYYVLSEHFNDKVINTNTGVDEQEIPTETLIETKEEVVIEQPTSDFELKEALFGVKFL